MEHLIDRFVRTDFATPISVSVIGDVMVDEYYEVTVNRISPEFPIPVMKSCHARPKKVPGGAANVALQFTNFNVEVYLTGIISQIMDMMPRKVKGHAPVDCGLPVPVKKRFYQGDFPLARWDVEESSYGLTPDVIGMKFDGFELKRTDVTVFSDYGKGLFDTGWHRPFLTDRTTIVDPKGNLDLWIGCTVLKPNSSEAEQYTGETDPSKQAQKLKRMVGCRDVVITQGGDGVVGVTPKGVFEYRPSNRPAEVNSVIGAGDCFVSFLAMGLAHGLTTEEAASLAFEAGAVYVQSKHNRPLKPAELLARKCGSRVVFTNGCFDILHAGHIQTLEFAKKQGDILVVGVNTDASVRRLKGERRPVNALEDRMKVLAAMKCVDCVVPFAEDTPLDLIRYVRPDVIVKGGDYRAEDVVGYDLAEVIIAPIVAGLSSSRLIEKVGIN